MTAQIPMSVPDLLKAATGRLAAAGVEDPELNAELMLSSILGTDRLRLRLESGHVPDDLTVSRFRKMLARRERREPLQYILGKVDFMGLTIAVTPAVLIPRPETELLVEEALRFLESCSENNPTVLDIGTGSGNIALAIAHYCRKARITAIDVSVDAVRVGASNARSLGIDSIRFVEADMFGEFQPGERFDLVVSNPPYVSLGEYSMLQPEIRLFEPKVAATDGSDGLQCIRRILQVAPQKLRPGGGLIMELGAGQSDAAVQFAEGSGFSTLRVQSDLSGIPRVLCAFTNPGPGVS